jgi:uncharacterized BrkB/YihY/UPF0761 family membrane protein
MGRLWQILRAAVSGFLANDALSRGASIAFYAATSLAPVLLIVVAIARLIRAPGSPAKLPVTSDHRNMNPASDYTSLRRRLSFVGIESVPEGGGFCS